MFELDARLREDTVPIGALPLCLCLLHRDARYPWVILVPQRADVRELHALAPGDRVALIEESCAIAAAMQRALGAEKMNVAALGNVVAQLHVHHVARYAHDDAWPAPIWGRHPPRAYGDEALAQRLEILTHAFSTIEGFAASPRP